MKIVLALLAIPLGIIIIIYSEKIGNFTGEISFAEKFLGSGGTFTFIKLSGLLTTILAIMYLSGGLNFNLSPLLGGK